MFEDDIKTISNFLYKTNLFKQYEDFLTEDLFRFEYIKKLKTYGYNPSIEKAYIDEVLNKLNNKQLLKKPRKSKIRLDLDCRKDKRKYALEFKYNKECFIKGSYTSKYGECLNDIRRLSLLSNEDYECYFVYLHKIGKYGVNSQVPIKKKLLELKKGDSFLVRDIVDRNQKEYSKNGCSSFKDEADLSKYCDDATCEIVFAKDILGNKYKYRVVVIKVDNNITK